MAVYANLKTENPGAVVTCTCGCESGIEIRIENIDDEFYAAGAFMNGQWFNESYSGIERFCKKCKKIWSVIRNKDYEYTDIIMTKKDWEDFKEFVNNVK